MKGGAEYMEDLLSKNSQGKVGGVIIDCTDFALDENSIAAELFTPKFYQNINNLLEEEGAFSQQITKPCYRDEFGERVKMGRFENIEIFMSKTPEYGGELPIAIVRK